GEAGFGGPVSTGGPGSDTLAAGFGTGFDGGGFGGAGLPRRVRQASLAPQLREATADQVAAGSGDDFWARSPEDTRSTMTAIQQGAERGRSVFDEPASPAE